MSPVPRDSMPVVGPHTLVSYCAVVVTMPRSRLTMNTWKQIPGLPGYECNAYGECRSYWLPTYRGTVIQETPRPLAGYRETTRHGAVRVMYTMRTPTGVHVKRSADALCRVWAEEVERCQSH